ncbi:MAG: B12-binding domain-containing radical SAM protein [Magnetospirillum sp.]|nr:B12-binding domain-containing radical SAM protein [Magnetospirillum sp.]
MDILLVNPDYDDRHNYPWGALNLGSYLRGVQGMDVALIDASVCGAEASFEHIRRRLPETDLVGLGFMSIDTPYVQRVARMIKQEKPSCRIVAGGPHPTLLPEQTAAYEDFDFVAYTEAELTTTRLIEELRTGSPDLAAVPGLCYRDGETIRKTPAPPLVSFYDIDYSLLDPSLEATFPKYMQIFAGRGCSFKCTFCFNAICGTAWRGRPMPDLFAEIRRLVDRYDPKVVYFRDENFFHDHKRIKEFVRLYRQEGFTFKWRALCRASYFNDKYMNADALRELASVGCTCLKYGFESGSDRVLRSLHKGILVRNIERVYDAHRDVPEIELVGNFMMGIPGEEAADYAATLDLIGKGLETVPEMQIVGPHYYRIYPGGVLYNRLVEEFGFTAPANFREWVERYSDKANRTGFADTNIRYPWVAPGNEYLTRNASALVRLAQPKHVLGQPNYKRWMYWPLHYAAKARLHYGYYGRLVDLRLYLALNKFSIWTVLQESSLFAALRRTAVYRKLQSGGLFRHLRRFLQRSTARS